MFRKLFLFATATTTAFAIACGDGSKNPSSPSGVSNGSTSTTDAAADGSTLKATPPEPVSPANNSTVEDASNIVLRVNPSTLKFTNGIQLRYRFQLLNGSTVVREFATGGRTWTLNELEINTSYNWRARAEAKGAFGPWSPTWTFRTPDEPEGYMRPGELYDPLYKGETVGKRIGATAFVKGKGVHILTQGGRVEYRLPDTVQSGEFSMLVTNLRTNTEGIKTKIMSMAEGFSDITTNDRRMTVEKRGDPAGIIAWRFISYLGAVDTVGAQRVKREFNPAKTYLWTASWRNQRFEVRIVEGVPNGKEIYRFGKPYKGPYNPDPHIAWVGGPPGRSGMNSGSVDGMIVRQVWLSNRPRPAFANR
jgi:hypothetical protein